MQAITASLSRATRVAFVAACVVVVVAGVRSAQDIIAPFLLAAFFAAISLPALDWLRSVGVRTGTAIVGIVLINAAVLSFFGWIVLESITELRAQLPFYVTRGQELEQALRARLALWGVDIGPEYYATLAQPERLVEMATSTARNLTSIAALGLLILLYLIFMLAESVAFPAKWRAVFGQNSLGIGGAAAALKEVQRYLALKTVISLATGTAVGIGAWIVGVDFALLWGFVAFALNYIPSIGSIIAAVPAVIVALLQFGIGRAFALGAIYLGINVIIGNFLDPILVGRQLRLSPIIVLMSLVFWGWTLGLTGMFLAVPLTIALRIIMQASDALAPYATLMGPLGSASTRRRTFATPLSSAAVSDGTQQGRAIE